jgi:hypothetical protein
MNSNQLTFGALAMVLNYQQTGCDKAAKRAIIALNALISSGDIPQELIQQSLEAVEGLETTHAQSGY